MPLLILSVGVTEPPPTRGAVYGRRERASFIARRDALTQPFQVLAPAFCFFQQHDIPRAAILRSLVCIRRQLLMYFSSKRAGPLLILRACTGQAY